jgi:hypothetical protein
MRVWFSDICATVTWTFELHVSTNRIQIPQFRSKPTVDAIRTKLQLQWQDLPELNLYCRSPSEDSYWRLTDVNMPVASRYILQLALSTPPVSPQGAHNAIVVPAAPLCVTLTIVFHRIRHSATRTDRYLRVGFTYAKFAILRWA